MIGVGVDNAFGIAGAIVGVIIVAVVLAAFCTPREGAERLGLPPKETDSDEIRKIVRDELAQFERRAKEDRDRRGLDL